MLLLELEAIGFVVDTETVEATGIFLLFRSSLLLLELEVVGFVVDTETGEGGGISFFLQTPLLVGFR